MIPGSYRLGFQILAQGAKDFIISLVLLENGPRAGSILDGNRIGRGERLAECAAFSTFLILVICLGVMCKMDVPSGWRSMLLIKRLASANIDIHVVFCSDPKP